MTKSFYPFTSGAGASVYEAQWSKMMRTVFKDGTVKGHLDELEVYGDSTGMQIKVKSGAGWVKGHFYENDDEEIIAVSAADPTNPRWDCVALEVDWTKSDNQMGVVVVAGTPAASPALPSLSQTSSKWQIPLAKIVVNAGVSTVTSGNVSDIRSFTQYTVINGVLHKQLWIGGFKPTLTNGCADSAQLETATNKNVIDYLAFDKDAIEYAYADAPMPQDYSGGVIYFQPYWLHPATTTDFKVSWGLQAVAIGDGDSLDVAQGAAVYSDDEGGVENELYIGPQSDAVSIAGSPFAGKLIQWRASRMATDVTNDTLGDDAYLRGFVIWYPVR